MMLKYLSSKPYKSLCYGLGVSASVFVLSACGGSSSSGGAVPAGPTISVSEASVVEGVLDSTTSVTFTLTLAEASDQATSVDYTTQDGTATSGEDYIAIASTLNFTAGETSATVTVDIVGDDTFEVDEYFALVLSNAQGLELNESSIGKGTIETDEDADSKGYFFGKATITIKSTEESTEESTVVSDLIGLAYNKRLMLFSKTGTPNVLYDIPEMAVTGTSYKATADIYVDGVKTTSVAVNGETTEANISGTMDGLDNTEVRFEVGFIEESNKRAATWPRIETDVSPFWVDEEYQNGGSSGFIFSSNVSERYFGEFVYPPSYCQFRGPLVLTTFSNIYLLEHEITSASGCDSISTDHTGFASVISDAAEDDTMIYAFSNGTISQFAVLAREI